MGFKECLHGLFKDTVLHGDLQFIFPDEGVLPHTADEGIASGQGAELPCSFSNPAAAVIGTDCSGSGTEKGFPDGIQMSPGDIYRE